MKIIFNGEMLSDERVYALVCKLAEDSGNTADEVRDALTSAFSTVDEIECTNEGRGVSPLSSTTTWRFSIQPASPLPSGTR